MLMVTLLMRIRLSVYFYCLLVLFAVFSFLAPKYKIESAAMTLFSVNSFLYGFYISPILGGQKSRIDELHKLVRSEANVLFSIMLKVKNADKHVSKEIKILIESYINACISERKSAQGEKQYEALIRYCVNYTGDSTEVKQVLDQLVSNESNRTSIAMQLNNKVYANEWWIMLVLFSITLSFVAVMNIGESWILKLVQALLCTGLTMLLVILLKLSTLTHKKAKLIWEPYKKLLETNFHQID